MLFSLSILNQQGQFREFNCVLDELEIGFDFINSVVAQGDTLLNVLLVENGKRTELSPALFDGTSSLLPMQELEQEWQMILSQPSRPAPIVDHELVALTQKRMRQCKGNMVHNQLMISKLQTLALRNQEEIHDEFTRYRLSRHYEVQINIFEKQVAKLQICQEKIARRLCELVPA